MHIAQVSRYTQQNFPAFLEKLAHQQPNALPTPRQVDWKFSSQFSSHLAASEWLCHTENQKRKFEEKNHNNFKQDFQIITTFCNVIISLKCSKLISILGLGFLSLISTEWIKL
jgi:hypothetical protein